MGNLKDALIYFAISATAVYFGTKNGIPPHLGAGFITMTLCMFLNHTMGGDIERLKSDNEQLESRLETMNELYHKSSMECIELHKKIKEMQE